MYTYINFHQGWKMTQKLGCSRTTSPKKALARIAAKAQDNASAENFNCHLQFSLSADFLWGRITDLSLSTREPTRGL